MINNVSHKKGWNSVVMQPNVEPPPTPIIKRKHDDKSDKYFVELNYCRDPTSSSSDLYKFNMALFENGNPEELLLFVRNFYMNLAASVTLATCAKNQYLRTLALGEALHHFDSFYSDVKGANPLNVENIILGLASYFFL